MKNKNKFYGVWCCIPDSYDQHLELDRTAFYENARKLYSARVAGIVSPLIVGQIDKHTTQELSVIASILSKASDHANAQYAVAIVCEDSSNALEKAKGIKEYSPDAVIVQVSAENCLTVLRTVCDILPNAAVYHFNLRGYTLMTGESYLKLKNELPSNFAGSLSNYTDYLDLTELFMNSGQLSHFTGEFTIVQGAMLGSIGVMGSLGAISPKPFLDIMDLCNQKKWDEALRIQNRIIEMFHEVYFKSDLKNHTDSEADLALAIAGGFLRLENRLRDSNCVDEALIQTISIILKEKYYDLMS